MLLDTGEQGAFLRRTALKEELDAPDFIDLEVISEFRKLERSGRTGHRRAAALDDLADFAVERVPHQAFHSQIWELRHNVTAYDATYVALAEAYRCPLWTYDRRLAAAPESDCDIVFPGPA
jgi:predicted nucleic acid-binding protein